MVYKYHIRILLLTMVFSMTLQAEPMSEQTCYAEPTIKTDFAELYSKLIASHYDMFAHVSRTQYDQWFKQMNQSISGCLSLHQVTVLFQKFVSRGRVAHAKIDIPTDGYIKHRNNGGKLFPLYVKSDGKDVWVSENHSAQSEIKPSAQILAINDISMSELLPKLRLYSSADTDRMFGGFLEFYMGMYLWLELGEQNQYQLAIKQDEQQSVVTVNAITLEQQKASVASQGETLNLDWQRTATILNDELAYLRPGPFFHTDSQAKDIWDNSAFKSFINESFEQFKQQQAQAVLIDLRNNPGGDNSFSDLMMQWIADKPFKFASDFKVKVSEAFKQANDNRLLTAEQKASNKAAVQYQKAYQHKPNGTVFDFELPMIEPHPQAIKVPVYILINRHSYSNAVTVAAMAQDYGFAQIIGEETTDLATTYGAMEHFKLGGTGIEVAFPKAFIVRPSGDNTIRGVVPDIAIDTPMVESADDPVLQQAVKLIVAELPPKDQN